MNSSDELNVAAVVKLLDYVSSGIGSVAGPMLATWRVRREAQAKRIAAKGEADALLIQAEAQSKAREILLSQDTEISGELDISDAVHQRIQERKRQLNIESVVKAAATQLSDTEVSNDEPDHDWTAHFFNHVQDVSSREMQLLWAKVLAGEVERAGSTSIRTLGILRNLDQSTARLFRIFCSGCVFLCIDGSTLVDARVPSLGGNAASNALKPHGLGFDELNRLNEHGIIISEPLAKLLRRAVFLPEGRPLRWDRPTLVSIMCCRKTPHDDHGGVEPCPCARCYRITGTPFNKSCSRGLRASLARWASATSLFVAVLELVRVEALLPYFRGQAGRPEEDRAALARAFIAKAVFDVPTTRGLIERLEVDGRLCRLCGWSGAGRLPSEATFSRAFSEFAESGLASRLHETLIARTMDGHLVEHISRDATAIEAREKPAPKPKARGASRW